MINLTELAATSTTGHHAPILPVLVLVIVVAVAVYFIMRSRKRRG